MVLRYTLQLSANLKEIEKIQSEYSPDNGIIKRKIIVKSP